MSGPTPNSDPSSLVLKLVTGFRLPSAADRLRDATLPLSAITAVADSSLDANPYFPPGLCPADLGDGAVIERLDERLFRVHERFEIGQMRFSELSFHDYSALRSAVIRFLKHYQVLLRLDRVRIKRWS